MASCKTPKLSRRVNVTLTGDIRDEVLRQVLDESALPPPETLRRLAYLGYLVCQIGNKVAAKSIVHSDTFGGIRAVDGIMSSNSSLAALLGTEKAKRRRIDLASTVRRARKDGVSVTAGQRAPASVDKLTPEKPKKSPRNKKVPATTSQPTEAQPATSWVDEMISDSPPPLPEYDPPASPPPPARTGKIGRLVSMFPQYEDS